MRKRAVTFLKRSGIRKIVDNFAGGGGASLGIKRAIGRDPDVAVNHNAEALAMHEANHPGTLHYKSSVWEIDPRVVCRNEPVGLAWFSPDCTDFSKAKGDTPVRKEIRGLAWVVIRWVKRVRPEVIMLENVEEFQQWGPVLPKLGPDGVQLRDPKGRLLWTPCPARRGKTFRKWVRALERLGYAVEWKELRACDYGDPTIRKRLFLIARCDGRPIRWPKPTHCDPRQLTKRAEMSSTLVEHRRSKILLPWRTAAEIIDWSIPCPSIFLTPKEARRLGCKRPLKPNTMNRIAAGLRRYVLESLNPFIVVANHGGDWFRGRGLDVPFQTLTASRDANGLVTPYVTTYYGPKADGENRGSSVDEPLRTQGTENRFGVVSPFLASPAHSTTTGRGPNVWDPNEPLRTTTGSNDKVVVAPHLQRQFGNSVGESVELPSPTVMPGGGGKSALVQAFIAQHNTGVVGHHPEVPLSTITSRGTQQQVVAAFTNRICQNGGNGSYTSPADEPLRTIVSKNEHCLSAAYLSHLRSHDGQGGLGEPINAVTAGGNHLAHTMAFLQKYYGSGGQDADCRDPMHTLTAKARMGLVTVEGIDFQLVDIGMRMLSARELFRAQGFDDDYIIDVWCDDRRNKDGKKMKPGFLTKEAQVRMCGNSVCPGMAEALVRANCSHLRSQKKQLRRQRELVLV